MNRVDPSALTAALAEANLAVLVSALAHLTGDLTLIDRHPDPRQFDHGRGPGTLPPAEAEAIRAEAVAVLGAPDGPVARPAADEASLHRIMEFCAGEEVGPGVRPARRGGGQLRRRRPAAIRVAPGARRRGAPELPRGHHRRRPRRLVRGDPARAGGDRLHRVRQEPRRRWYLVREHVPRPAGRRPQPLLLVLLPAQSRLVPLLRPPRRAGRVHRDAAPRSTASSRTSAAAPRCSSADVRRTPRPVGGAAVRRRRHGGANRGRRADQRGGHAEPALDPRPRRASTRSRARGSTRRAGTTTSTSKAGGSPSSGPGRVRCSSCPPSRPTSSS